MGLFNFFKKKETLIEEPVEETVTLENLKNFLSNKMVNIDLDSTFEEITAKITELKEETEEQISITNNVDYSKIKADNKSITITKENWKTYKAQTERLISDLEKINESKLEKFLNKINDLFKTYYLRTENNLQKASFFLGKEVHAVHDLLVEFSRYITRVNKENQENFTLIHTIDNLNNKLLFLKERSNFLNEVKTENKLVKENVTRLINEEKQTLSDIEKIKSSQEYQENREEKIKFYQDQKKLQNELLGLRTLINFKALGNEFHSEEKLMNKIKAIKENFNEEFLKDNGNTLINFLQQAKIYDDKTNTKINSIKSMNKLLESRDVNEDSTIKDKESDLSKLRSELKSYFDSKEKRKKHLGRSKANVDNTISDIKTELKGINVIMK